MSTPGSPVDPKSSLGSLSCDSGYVDPTPIVTVPILHQEPKVRRVSALSTDWISEKKATQKKNSDPPEENLHRSSQEKSHIPRPSKRATKADASWRLFEKEAGKIGVQPMLKKEELDTTSSKAFKFLAKFHPKYKEERPVAPRKQRSKSAEGRPRKSLSMFNSAYTKVISPNTMRKRDEWANTLRSDSILDEEYYKLPYEEINREILGRFSKSEPRLASLRKAKKKVSFTEDVDYNTGDVKSKSDLQSFPSRDSGYFGEKSPDRVKPMDFGHFSEVSHIKQLNEVSVPTIITKQNFAELENLLDLVKQQERRLSDDSAQSSDTSDDDCFSKGSEETEQSHDHQIIQDQPPIKPIPLPRTKLPSNSDLVHANLESSQDVAKTNSTDDSTEENLQKSSQAINKILLTTNLDDILANLSSTGAPSNAEFVTSKEEFSTVERLTEDGTLESMANEENHIAPGQECNSTIELVSEEQLSETEDSFDQNLEQSHDPLERMGVASPYLTDCSEVLTQDISTSQDQTEDFVYYDEPASLDVIAEIPDEEYWIPSPRSDYELLEGYHPTSQGLEVVVEVPEDSPTPEPVSKETVRISSQSLTTSNNSKYSDSGTGSEDEGEEKEDEEESTDNTHHSDALTENETSDNSSQVESSESSAIDDTTEIKCQNQITNESQQECQKNTDVSFPELSQPPSDPANCSSPDRECFDDTQTNISLHHERSQLGSDDSEGTVSNSDIDDNQDFHGIINQIDLQEVTNSSCTTEVPQVTSDQKRTTDNYHQDYNTLQENCFAVEEDRCQKMKKITEEDDITVSLDPDQIVNPDDQKKNNGNLHQYNETQDDCLMNQSNEVNPNGYIVSQSLELITENFAKDPKPDARASIEQDQQQQLQATSEGRSAPEESSTLPNTSEFVKVSCTNSHNTSQEIQSSPTTESTEVSREAHRQKIIDARKAFFEPNSQNSQVNTQKFPSISVECDNDTEKDTDQTHNIPPEAHIEVTKQDSLKPEMELKRPSSPTPQSPLNQELLSDLPQRTSTPENCLDVPSFQYNSDSNDVTSTSEYVDSIFLSDTVQYDKIVEEQLLYGTKGREENVDDADDFQRKDEDIELESDSGKSSNSDGIEYDSAAETGSDSDELLHIDMSRDTNFDSSFTSEDSLLSKPYKEVELSKSLSQIVEYDSATESGSDKEESNGSTPSSTPDRDSFGGKGKSPICQKTEYDSAFSTASTPFSEPDSDIHQTDVNQNIPGKSSCTISHETSTSTKLKMRHDFNIPGAKITQTTYSGSPSRKRNSTLLSSFTKPLEVEAKTPMEPKNLSPKELEEFNRQKIKEALLKAGISPSVLELLDKDKQVEKSGFDTSMANIFMTKDFSFTDHQLVLNTRTNSVKPRVTVSRVRVPLSQIRNGWLFSSDPPLVDKKIPEPIESEKLLEPKQTIPSDSPTPSSSSDGSSSGCFSSACSPIPVPGTLVREVPFPTAL